MWPSWPTDPLQRRSMRQIRRMRLDAKQKEWTKTLCVSFPDPFCVDSVG